MTLIHPVQQTLIRAKRSFRRHSKIALNIAGFYTVPKIFVIGFNKSGTTAMHNLFLSMGFLSNHGVKWRSCDDILLLRKYDCFSDGIPRDLPKLDRLFPGSRFILQVRDLESWVFSRLAHVERNQKNKGHKAHPDWDVTIESVTGWILKRNAYHLKTMAYFSDRPENFLILNYIRDPNASIKISQFLGHEERFEKPKAHVNPTKTTPDHYREILLTSARNLGVSEEELQFDLYCPSLLKEDQRSEFPYDTSMLK